MPGQMKLHGLVAATIMVTITTGVFALTQDEIDDLPRVQGTHWVKFGFLFITADSGLLIRSKPDIKSKAVTLLKKGDFFHYKGATGDPLTIENITSRWLIYDGPAGKGFVFGGFVSAQPPLFVYTKEQVAEFERKNGEMREQEEAQRQTAAADAAKRGEFYQNCSPPCEASFLDWQRVEFGAGCTAEKRAKIRSMMKTRGGTVYDAVHEMDDPYCLGLLSHSQQQAAQPSCTTEHSFFDEK